MVLAKEVTRCPHCREAIVKGATVCKHCQSEIATEPKRLRWLRKFDTFRTGFLAGILFSLIVLYLAYRHFN